MRSPPDLHALIETRPQQIAPLDAARYESRFASRATSIVSSAMRDLMALAARPEIISLAGGFPDTESFPREIFNEVMAAVTSEHVASALQYGPTEGLPELRERVLEIMAHEGLIALYDDVMITSGGQQAIDLSIRTFVNPGDLVIAEGPTYPGAVPSLTTYEADVVHVDMDEDGLRIDLLEETLDRLDAEGRRPKLLYTIPNFHNPAGVTMSRERRERLVDLAHRRELIVVEDNPYGQIRFEGEPLPTLYQLDDGAGWVIYCSTFSKILAPGTRLGWVVAPQPVLRKMNLGKQGADLCASTLSQRFVIEYLRRYDWRDHVGRLNGIYRSRRDAMLSALDDYFPGEATWTRPAGGLFVWATLPDFVDTRDLLARATSQREVAFVPGEAAFRDGRGKHSMRLNFSYVDEDTIREGIRRLGETIVDMMEDYRALNPGSP